MKKQLQAAIVTAFLMTAALYAQDGSLPPPPGGGMMGPGHFGLGGFGGRAKVVTGAPYSADVSNQSVQTLPDGNTITHNVSGHVARDSQGRTYSQETITGGPLGQNGPVTMTFISDPVAGYIYSLNSSTKIASRRILRTPPTGTSTDSASKGFAGRGHFGPQSSADAVASDLGTQTIAGVNAQGTSKTRTIAAGVMGNAQPITSTSETWYSPDLQVPVLAKRNDPRTGQSTYALTNIQRAEPSASLFQVPSDYTVQDAANGHGNRAAHARPSVQ